MLFPFLWIISNSFKTTAEVFSFPPGLIPKSLKLEHYDSLFEEWDFLRWYLNSAKVIVMRMAFSLLFSSLGGFALAKYRFPGKKVIFLIILGSMIIPYRVLIIPMFLVIHRLGLFNTHIALILPWIATPFGIFMMRQYLLSIPDELIEAARIDGAGGLWVYFKIILPLGRAGLGALSVVLFVWTWTAFIWPLVVLFSSEKFTLTIGMSNIISGWAALDYVPTMMAGASLSTIPILVLFVFVQRYFVAGLTAGALK